MKNRWVKKGNFEIDYRDYAMQMTDEDREASAYMQVEFLHAGHDRILIAGRAWKNDIEISYFTKNSELASKIHSTLSVVENNNLVLAEEKRESQVRWRANKAIPQTIEVFFLKVSSVCNHLTNDLINNIYREIGVERLSADKKQEVLRAPKQAGVFGKLAVENNDAAAASVQDGAGLRV